MRIRDIAFSRISYGYRRVHVLLKREGWQINHKRVYRLYKLEGLGMRTKRHHRHVTGCRRMERVDATHPNECWSTCCLKINCYRRSIGCLIIPVTELSSGVNEKKTIRDVQPIAITSPDYHLFASTIPQDSSLGKRQRVQPVWMC